jgi:hypothetical protein
MEIRRTEPATGGPNRTPRERIEPVFGPHDEVEPDLAFDASSSEGWPWDSNPKVSTWGVQIGFLRGLVAAAEQLDSQAKAEQASGSDEFGGLYAAGFNHDVIVVGEGDDDGDLNSSNMTRKIEAIRVPDETGKQVPLPYGGTAIMPAIRYLDDHYLSEFGERPVAERPKRARVVSTDGAMSDYEEFGRRLAEDHSDKWPDEQWFIAILGPAGAEHDRTLALYNEVAAKHPNVHVYSFENVSNENEIAEDMAIATLATKAA